MPQFIVWLKRATGFEAPFFIFATLVLAGIGIQAGLTSPVLRDPLRLVAFSLLMFVHIGLYWLVVIFAEDPFKISLYFFVQGLLVLELILLGQNLSLSFGLPMAMIGLVIGSMKLTRWGMVFIVYFLGLSLASYTSLVGWSGAIWWIVTVIPTGFFVGLYVLLYNRQTEAKTRAQGLLVELEKANHQLAEYADRVEDLTLTAERQRMARELHDTLSQGLAGLILQLEAVEAHLGAQRGPRAAAILHDAILQARSTLAESRRAIDDLRQSGAEVSDLAQAVQRETARFSAATGILCEVSLDLPAALPDGQAETIRRTVAEGLTNIARHAHATRCQVTAGCQVGWLEVTVSDDGQGFDPGSAVTQAGHYGLLGMTERARLAQGEFIITSQPGAGATLHLRLPMGEK